MSEKGLILYHSYLETMKELSDVEFGRLVRAALEYSVAGTARQLSGNERFLFATIKFQIDNNSEKYQKVCERNKSNGQSGGRPKKDKEKTQSVSEKPKKANVNVNEKVNVNITPLSTTVLSSPTGKSERLNELFEKFWEAYPQKVAKPKAVKAFEKIPKIPFCQTQYLIMYQAFLQH